ncbi:hypothetical protein HNP24_002737 [Chryseobacterium sediminis]|uniref:Uncharacterized protein n=1 Tax=Chryseobacterium sediminis TaxID=1679494 RepID=A0ABR6Q3A6_9FLAO|nr:hypothetical protein [Chryseobacterium sediminis]
MFFKNLTNKSAQNKKINLKNHKTAKIYLIKYVKNKIFDKKNNTNFSIDAIYS